MTTQEMLAELNRLRAENDNLRKPRNTITFKISEKGGLSICGLQKFPVTLYRNQWERVIEHVPQIQKFIAENATKLKEKPVKE